MELKGRVALITGSTSGGMGRSTAFTLAKNGADIVLNYGTNRKDAEADEASREVEKTLRGLGREVLLVKADTKKPEDVSALVSEAVKRFQKIDILVNNAGGGWNPKDLTETPPDSSRKSSRPKSPEPFTASGNACRSCGRISGAGSSTSASSTPATGRRMDPRPSNTPSARPAGCSSPGILRLKSGNTTSQSTW